MPHSIRRRGRGQAALCAGVLALAPLLQGCVSSGETVPCPRAAIMPDLMAVARFKPGGGKSDNDLAYGARMLAVTVTCSSSDKGKSVDVTTKLGVTAVRTDRETKDGQVTYFVAVVNRGNGIDAKREFVIDIKFVTQQSRIEITEEHHEKIPLPKGTSGADYGLIFGFQLTPEELEYNRARIKVPGSG